MYRSANQHSAVQIFRRNVMSGNETQQKREVDGVSLMLILCIIAIFGSVLYSLSVGQKAISAMEALKTPAQKKLSFAEKILSEHAVVCIEGVEYFVANLPRTGSTGTITSPKWKKDGTIATCE